MKDFLQLNRNIQLRIVMTFIGVLTYFTAGSSMTIYYNQHLGAAVTGLLLIIASIVSFVVGMVSGHFSDLKGRKPTMLIGMLTAVVGATIAVLSNSPLFFNPWTTFLGFVITSFGYGFFNSGAEAMLVDITTPENRKIVYSLGYWVLNLAAAIGSGLSGWLFRDYLIVLLLLILIGDLVNLAIVQFLITETFDATKQAEDQETNIFKAYRLVSKDKTFMIYMLASLCLTVLFHQPSYFIAIHLTNSFTTTHLFGLLIYGQRMLSLMALINTIMVISLLSMVRRITSHWSNKRGFAVGAILMGIGWTLSVWTHTFAFELLAILINTVGELIIVPFEQSLRADLMNPQQVGAYTGAFSATDPVASVFAGLLVSLSPLYGSLGMGLVLLLVTFASVALGMVSIGRYEQAIR